MTKIQIILAVGSLMFTITVINLIRKESLDLKYSLLWLFSGICLILLAINHQVLSYLSSILDIVVPVNLLFLVGNLFLIAIVFSLTVALSRNSRRIRNLTQEVALLKNETEQLEKKISNIDTTL
ncbi:MAG: DUF2304 domain-containing protein [Firmicutes bacterium HGW-Firmicutes-12]|jgi:hypothetical protein|nr:MAG: DUF2304 domain-containing protein [Firmicutes bacterium HGW-Firmicutes-12]